MSDLIDRQRALDAFDYWVKSPMVGYSNGLLRLHEMLEEIPPVTAEKPNKWIPVSERLPEDHKDVLICLSSDQICIGCYNSHRLPFSNHAIGWGASYVHDWCSDDVIAWMPLPEPYKQEVEE